MAPGPGSRIGPYEVVAAVAAGGMGEVYRARDTRLGRDVALKVLPEPFASDPNRVARFDREARLLATLNHPHIAAIYGVEESPTGAVLVLEFVEGPTLAERLQAGPLPLDEAVPIARQICDALAAAHAHGIVHRDLKPSNVKVRPDGAVKVLDLGLAKALADEGTGADPSVSPTFTAATRVGVILGTAAYMSPEQARGRAVDKRADIWAFGCVLYEMLVGRRAFGGDDVSDTLAEVIKSEPDWTALPSGTPAAIRRLLRRSLVKDPAKRLADIADARLDLDDESADAPPSSASRRPDFRRERLIWIASAILLATAAAGALWRVRAPVDSPELRVEVLTPPPTDASIAISPDGRKIAFVAGPGNVGRLWYRSLDSTTAHPLPGTDGARLPFWSSDGGAIGFFTDSHLKRVDVDTGAVRVLSVITTSGGGTWHGDTIVFAPNSVVGQLFRMPAGGGTPVAITHPATNKGPVGHRHPQFLPDGRHFLFAETTAGGGSAIFVGDLGGSAPVHLFDAESAAVYAGSGHLLFVSQGTLYAQPFDMAALKPRDKPVALAEDIAAAIQGRPAVSASATGAIVYRTGAAAGLRRLIWFDRSGKEVARIDDPEPAQITNPSLSRDGRRLALQKTAQGNTDIWTVDLVRGVFTRLTSAPTIEALPIWSPDGLSIAFNSRRTTSVGILMKASDDVSGAERIVLDTPAPSRLCDWSRDGRLLLYKKFDTTAGSHDLWALPLDGKPPFPVVQGPGDDRDGQFSPDGKWIAYESNESGNAEVYLQRFPGPGGKERVSTTGGSQVRWRDDGTELFYIDPEGRLIALTIKLPAGDGVPDIGAPTRLFVTKMPYTYLAVTRQQYVVEKDAQRFLVNTVASDVSPITLLLNWQPAVK